MSYHNMKNLCALLAFVSTVIGVCVQPQLVKWLLAFYIIELIAIWLGDENE